MNEVDKYFFTFRLFVSLCLYYISGECGGRYSTRYGHQGVYEHWWSGGAVPSLTTRGPHEHEWFGGVQYPTRPPGAHTSSSTKVSLFRSRVG